MLNISLTVSSTRQEKLANLEKTLKSFRTAIVAFSGGIDSTLLSFYATKYLADKALIVFANSPVIPHQELLNARNIAAHLNFNYIEINHNQLQIADFVCNNEDRCYHCKIDLLKQLKSLATSKHIDVICDGSNFDDLSDYRPGLKAVTELGMRSPLTESFLTKSDIQTTGKELGLPNWNKPATPCLSSRIPYGTKVTSEIIEKIDKAETYLKNLGIKEVRLRHHDNIARIEVSESDIPVATSDKMRKDIVNYVKSLGYVYVTIDLQGFRSGSLNETLNKQKATD